MMSGRCSNAPLDVAALVLATGLGVNALAQGWAPQSSGAPSSGLNDVHFVNENVGFVAGSGAVLLATTDGGANWDSLNLGLSAGYAMNAVWFSDAATGYVAGAGATLMKTTDSGKTWTDQVSSLLVLQLNAMHFADAGVGCAVGREVSGGALLLVAYCTRDSGATWSPFRMGPSWNLNAVHLANARIGYAVGDSGLFFRTADSGATWTSRSSGAYPSILMGVHFHDSATGWIVGSRGLIRKTTDGGMTWTTQNSGVTVTLWEVNFHGPDTGYAVGNSGTILKTLDGGANWAPDGFGSIQGFYGVHFPASGIGYVVGSTGTILKTTPTTFIKPIRNRNAYEWFPPPLIFFDPLGRKMREDASNRKIGFQK